MGTTETTSSTTPTRTLLYFAYDSDVSQMQMSRRCPNSPLAGLGRLRGHRWFISAHGHGTVAESSSADQNPGSASDSSPHSKSVTDPGREEVWGLVYDLSPADEARLDRIERVVPGGAREKRRAPVELLPLPPPPPESPPATPPGGRLNSTPHPVVAGTVVDMLLYADVPRHEWGEPQTAPGLPEYVAQMNQAIRDALGAGVPREYVDDVLRKYIPAEGEPVPLASNNTALGGIDAAGRGSGASLSPSSSSVNEPRMGSTMGSGTFVAEEEELPERASEVCYMREYMF